MSRTSKLYAAKGLTSPSTHTPIMAKEKEEVQPSFSRTSLLYAQKGLTRPTAITPIIQVTTPNTTRLKALEPTTTTNSQVSIGPVNRFNSGLTAMEHDRSSNYKAPAKYTYESVQDRINNYQTDFDTVVKHYGATQDEDGTWHFMSQEGLDAANRLQQEMEAALTDYNGYYSSKDYAKPRMASLEIELEEAREEVQKAQNALSAYEGMYMGSLDFPNIKAEYERLQGNVKTALDRKNALEAERMSIANSYYKQENETQFQKLSTDSGANDLYTSAKTAQSDMEKVAYMINAYTNGENSAKTREYKAYLMEQYGLTEEAFTLAPDMSMVGQRSLQQLYSDLSAQVKQAQSELEGQGYNYERMTGYEGMIEKAEEYKFEIKRIEAAAKEMPVAGSIVSVIAAPMQGADYARLALGNIGHNDIADLENYVPLNVYDMDATNLVTTIRNTVSKEIEKKTDWEIAGQNVASFLYQTGMSIADSASQIALFGTFGTYVMGASAAAQTTKEAIERGATNGQALTMGLAAGAAEAIFEKFSVDNLLAKKNVTGVLSALKETAKQAGVEASEEAFTEIANILTDVVIMKDKSNFNQMVAYYQSAEGGGLSEEDAKKQTFMDMLKQVGWSAAGGALSGGFMGGGTTLYQGANYSIQAQSLGQQLQTAGGLEQVELALAFAEDTKTVKQLETMQAQLKDGQAVDAGTLGKVAIENMEKVRELVAQAQQLSTPEVAKALNNLHAQGNNSGYYTKAVVSDLRNAVAQARAGATTLEAKAAVTQKVNPEASVQDAATTLFLQAGFNLKTAQIRSDVVRRLVEGDETVTERDINKLEPTHPITKKIFTEVTGVQFPDTKLSTKQLYEIYRSAHTVAQQKQEAQAQQAQAAEALQVIQAQTVADSPAGGNDQTAFAHFMSEAQQQFPNVSQEQLSAAYNQHLNGTKTVSFAGRSLNRDQFVQMMKSSPNGQALSQNELDAMFNRAILDTLRGKDAFARYALNQKQQTVTPEGNAALRATQDALAQRWTNILKKFGIREVRFADDMMGEENGFYLNGVVTFNRKQITDEWALVWTLGHELVHSIRDAGQRKVFVDDVIKTFEALDELTDTQKMVDAKRATYTNHNRQMIEKEIAELKEKGELKAEKEVEQYRKRKVEAFDRICTDDYLREEIAADQMSKAFRNRDMMVKLGAAKPSLLYKAKQILNRLLKQTDDKAAREAIENLQNRLLDAIRVTEASATYESGYTVTNENGDPVAQSDEDGSMKFSLRTYDESGRQVLSDWMDVAVENNDLTREDADEILRAMDDIYRVCQDVREDYAPFDNWSEAKVVTDSEGHPVFSVVKKNGEYAMNLDFSTVCKKRRTLDAVLNELIARGDIEKIQFDKEGTNFVRINDIIREHGFETACALCFVDAKRFKQANVADTFVNMWNKTVKSIAPKDAMIASFNFGNNGLVDDSVVGIEEMNDLDLSALDKVMKKNGERTVPYAIAKHLKENPQDRKLLMRGDFLSSEGFTTVSVEKPEIYNLFVRKKGTAGPKSTFPDVQYLNEIIRSKRFDAEKAYAVGGVRVQSFSDYVPRMVFDYVQMFADMAAKKLPAHAYTKEELFVKQFGLTGIKINMSLIPAVVEDGIAPGLDAEGNYVWADESFDYNEAKRIQRAEGYSRNCGTICVGISDEHIRQLLADDTIRMVIPYHKSGLNRIIATMNNVERFTDYTKKQNTRHKDGTKLSKDEMSEVPDFNQRLHELGAEGNPRAVAEEYVRWCEGNDYLPKFDQFVYQQIDGVFVEENGKKVVDPNYYKLLVDFSVYDNGTYTPQEGVTMAFPTEDSAFGSMAELIKRGLEEDAILEGKRSAEVGKIADEIEHEMVPGKRYSIVGEQAADDNKLGLAGARVMSALGMSNTQTHKATGWYKGKDGKWRFEISDRTMKYLAPNITSGKITDFVRHSVLFRNYPQLQNVMVYADITEDGVAGSTEGNEIHINPSFDETEIKKTLIHELQHMVQEIEGFAPGSNPTAAYAELFITAKQMLEERGALDSIQGYEAKVDAVEKEILARFGKLNASEEDSMAHAITRVYDHSVGEKEARNTEERINLSSSERAARAPYMADVGVVTDLSTLPAMYNDAHKALGWNGIDKKHAPIYNRARKRWYGEAENGNARLRNDARDLYREQSGLRDDGRDESELRVSGQLHQLSGKEGTTQESSLVQEDLQDKMSPKASDDSGAFSLPEMRYSIDSTGRQLTEGQQSFFTNSQVRDEEGRLIPVFHGTPAGGFTEFKVPESLSRMMNAQGAGFYFTDDKNARQYMKPVNGKAKGDAQLYEVYLNLTNPLVIDSYGGTTISKEQFKEVIRRGNYGWFRERGLAHHARLGQDASFEEQLDAWTEKVFHAAIDDADVLAEMTLAYRGDAILDVMKDVLGHDGVRYRDQYGDIWVAWSGNQIKNVDNLNPTESDDIRYSLDDGEYAPTFYSHMGKVIDEMKMPRLGAANGINYLKGRGVKDEEIKWSGIEEFFADKKSVSKEELQEFVRNNQLVIEEEVLGDKDNIELTEREQQRVDRYREIREEAAAEIDKLLEDGPLDLHAEWQASKELAESPMGLGYIARSDFRLLGEAAENYYQKELRDRKEPSPTSAEWRAFVNRNDDFGFDNSVDPIRYILSDPVSVARNYDMSDEDKQYLLDFAELKKRNDKVAQEWSRDSEAVKLRDIEAWVDEAMDAFAAEERILETAKKNMHRTRWKQYSTNGGYNYREILFRMPGSDYSNSSMVAHWKEGVQGILAHARIQDFDTADGKMLFIEEIQSDWHNEGQKYGYDTGMTQAEKETEREKIRAEFMSSEVGQSIIEKVKQQREADGWQQPFRDDNEAYEWIAFQPADIISELMEYPHLATAERIDALNDLEKKVKKLEGGVPEAPFSKNYHEFVLKRLMREAAEQGYDSIGWTTGKMQEERWSSEYAEGYRIEYDQDIPKFLNKYGKKWGAKVDQTYLDTNGYNPEDVREREMELLMALEAAREQAENTDLMNTDIDAFRANQRTITNIEETLEHLKGTKVWTLPITDAMRESVLYEGQPRFSLAATLDGRPYVEVNIDQDVFDGLTTAQMQETAKNIIKSRFKGKVIGANYTAYVNKTGAEHFAYPANRRMDEGVKRDKMRTAPELDTIMQASIYRDNVTPDKGKHPDATGGLDKLDVMYKVGSRAYEGEITVKVTDRGRVFYDMTKIKDITAREIGQIPGLGTAETGSNASGVNVAQEEDNVKYSLSDSEDPDIRYSITPEFEEWYLSQFPADQQNHARANLDGARRWEQLQAQTKEGDFHPEGANGVREVHAPKYDFDEKPISKSVSTVMGAKAIPDDVVVQLQSMAANGDFSYGYKSDKSALQKAKLSINSIGFEGAMERFRTAVNAGKMSKDIAVLGQVLLNNAANSGDGKAVAELMCLYQTLNTHAGQTLQAMSIFRKLAPESQLYGVQKMAEKLDEEIRKKRGKKAVDELADEYGVKIDQSLIDKFLSQTDQEGRDAVMDEIYQNIADQVPSTWMDKWNAWRYLAMLGNLRTHIRNIAGNALFQPVVLTKNVAATLMEAATYHLGGKSHGMERNKAFTADPALYKMAWNDFGNAKEALEGSKYNDVQNIIMDKRTIFKFKPLEALRKANSGALSVEDAIFKRLTYTYSLASYLRSHGVKGKTLGQISPELLSKARDYAGKEALKATYNDTNALSSAVGRLSGLSKSDKAVVRAAGVVLEGALPFKKTPANILVRGLEYSPIGLAKGLTYDLVKVAKHEKTAAEAMDAIASGLSGSALFALGVVLAAMGRVTGGAGDDKDDEWAEQLGHQGYALELDDGTAVTLDWLAPEAIPFFMGVELLNAIGENGFQMDDIWTMTKQLVNPMMEMSMLQSLNDLLDTVSYSDSKLTDIVLSALISYISQGVPTIGGQIERTGETERTSTYTDKTNTLIPTDVQYAIGKASAKIPGWDYQQIPYIDVWGQPESTGGLPDRAFNNFFNPAYISQIEVDAVEEELQRLRDGLGNTTVYPSKVNRYIEVNQERIDLTAEQYVTYATTVGQTRYSLLADGMETDAYRNMTDAEKAEYVSKVYTFANAVGKMAVSDYTTDDKWIHATMNAQKEIGVSPAEFLSLYVAAGNLTGYKDEKGNTVDNSQPLKVAVMVYDCGYDEDTTAKLLEALGVSKTVRSWNPNLARRKLEQMEKKYGS